MSDLTIFRQRFRETFVLATFVTSIPLTSAVAQQSEDTAGGVVEATPADNGPIELEAEPSQPKLKFSFRHAPWEDVLEWLAEEADLSFSTEVVPTGTFNYIDEDQSFTAKEAIDLVNSYLLIKGYTIVRKGKMMIVIDLEDELDAQLVRDLLVETPVAELDKRGEYEITKTRFNLDKVDAAEAEKQISQLMSPVGSIVVMPGAKQMMATETGGTLRMIREILASLEKTAAEDEKGKLHTFPLKIATADEVLLVARPLLGIEEEKFASEDGTIRISAGALGRMVFATGDADSIKLIKQIVEQVDARDTASDSSGVLEMHQFMSHKVSTADSDSVLRVLQTLFVGDQAVRLEINRSTGGIFAYAKPSQHRAIRATIAEMELNPERVEVIALRNTDPAAATLLIEKLFSTSQKPPIVDGTLNPPQLVVRGSQPQIEQIRLLLDDMGERAGFGGLMATAAPRTGNVRMIPMTPETANMAIQRIQRIWPTLSRQNEIRIVAPTEESILRTFPRDDRLQRRGPRRGMGPRGRRPELERTPGETNEPAEPSGEDREARIQADTPFVTHSVIAQDVSAQDESAANDTEPEVVELESATPPTDEQRTGGSDIVVAPTPDGLMISSDDTEALNAIHALIEAFAATEATSGPRFNLFYLKHVEAETAQTLLTSILTGLTSSPPPTISASTGSTSTPRTGPVSLQPSSSSALGIGMPHMVADKRLNAIFVHGEPTEVAMIKQLLEVIDIESGPEEVLTFPKPRFIPVFNTDAENVAKVIREVYANRIIKEETRSRDNNQDRNRGGFPFGGFGRGRGGDQDNNRGGNATPQATGDLPMMTVGVDIETNSLVVSAPGPLLSEVESVVQELDRRAADKPPESIAVFNLKRTEPYVIRDTLVNLLGDQVEVSDASSSDSRSRTSSRESSRPNSGPSTGVPFMRQPGTGGRIGDRYLQPNASHAGPDARSRCNHSRWTVRGGTGRGGFPARGGGTDGSRGGGGRGGANEAAADGNVILRTEQR